MTERSSETTAILPIKARESLQAVNNRKNNLEQQRNGLQKQKVESTPMGCPDFFCV